MYKNNNFAWWKIEIQTRIFCEFNAWEISECWQNYDYVVLLSSSSIVRYFIQYGAPQLIKNIDQ